MSSGLLSEGEEIELRRLKDWEQLKIIEQQRKELERLRQAKPGEAEWSKAMEAASSPASSRTTPGPIPRQSRNASQWDESMVWTVVA